MAHIIYHRIYIACAFCGLILYNTFIPLFWLNYKPTFDSNGLQGRRVVEFYHRRLYWDTELTVFLRACNTQNKNPKCLQRNMDEHFIYSWQYCNHLWLIYYIVENDFRNQFQQFTSGSLFRDIGQQWKKNEFVLTPQLLCMETKLAIKDKPHLTTQYMPDSKSWIYLSVFALMTFQVFEARRLLYKLWMFIVWIFPIWCNDEFLMILRININYFPL
jgi:hypothetical protein